jgi:hypothetical protein
MSKLKPIVFKQGAWSKHVPFAYELTKDIQPNIIVELGSHKGESYFSFCQSVKDHNLATVCYAVDTWIGDDHAGKYGDDVFTEVSKINEKNFSNFSYLIRSTFADAAKNFSNESIDLLHIDGFHTYEAVKDDFEGWIDKVAPGGIVLFHDIMVRHDDFGVWKFWEEIQKKYVTFEFKYGYGLGVLFKDPKAIRNNTSLIETMLKKDSEASIRLHDYYQSYYNELEIAQTLGLVEIENAHLKEMCQKLESQVNNLKQMYEDLQQKFEVQQEKLREVREHFLFPLARVFLRRTEK